MVPGIRDGSIKKHANKGRDDSSTKVIPTFVFVWNFRGTWKKKVGITFVLESSLPLFACFWYCHPYFLEQFLIVFILV